MNIAKTIGNISLFILAIIAIIIDFALGFYMIFNNKITTGTNYIDNQIGINVIDSTKLTEKEKDEYEERWFLEANYFDNSNKNGIELQELKLNYFTDSTLASDKYRSTGMQFLGDFETYHREFSSIEEENANKKQNDFLYYDSSNAISFDSNNLGTQLDRNKILNIKIDNRSFTIQLTGQYDVYKKFLGLFKYKEKTVFYDYGDVFYDIFKAIKSNSYGYGDFYITVDLSLYFTISEVDDNGNIITADAVDFIQNYSVLKIHYEKNGATNSNQSIFGLIDNNRNYNTNEDHDTTYWQERVVYNLTEKDLDYRFSERYNGYFASLKLDIKNMFEQMPRTKIKISLDLNSRYLIDNKINLVGLDYNAFENFEIDTLELSGKTQTFYLLEKCLFNSKLVTLKHSNNVTLDFKADAINNEYSEVIL